MPVSFERIPANIRVPLFYAEVSNREAAYFQILQPTLLIGPMLPSGLAEPLEPVLVTDAAQGAGLFGAGSIPDMMAYYRRNDTFGTVWCIGHEEPTGATAATISDRIVGVATAAGMMAVYLGGARYTVTVRMGESGEEVCADLAATINADPFCLCTAEADEAEEVATRASGEITFTSKSGGALGNQILRAWNWRGTAGGEAIPPGLAIQPVSGDDLIGMLSGGAGLPDMAPIIAAMGDDEYDFIANPYTDAASLDAFQEEMNDVTGRWAWSRQIYGHVFSAMMGALQPLVTFGRTRNDPHTSVMGYALSPTASWRVAAAFCAQAATSLRIDPARPLQTLTMVGVMPPRRGSRFGIGDSNTLLFSGVATAMESGGATAIQRAITTYRVNVWNQPDPSWLDVQAPATLAYIIRFLRQRILQKFPRHKLADDGTPLGFGQATVTPRIIKAELIAAYSELMLAGIVENMDAFKAFLIVERDQNDPNRVNVLLPPDLVNQLRIFALLAEFRLQYSPGSMAAAGMTPLAMLAPVPPVAVF
jgi:phage tail sheath gpL-like